MQVCLLLQGLIDGKLATGLQVYLVLQLFLSLRLDFDVGVVVLLQAVLVFVELIAVLV